MSSDSSPAYRALLEHMRQVSSLESISQLLEWDELTKMPPGGVEHRAEQVTQLAALIHERMTSSSLGEWIDALTDAPALDDPTADAAVNVQRIRKRYLREIKTPPALVRELSRTAVLGQAAWLDARKANDFAIFKPWLGRIFELKRQQAEALGYEASPYDPLLDQFEPDMPTSQATTVLGELRDALIPMIQLIATSGRRPDDAVLRRRYPIDGQAAFARAAARAIGFDFHRGRLDVTVHPFCCTVGPGDVRITTRYDENHFGQAFFSVLHEAGHGLYEQGLPAEQFGRPLGQAASAGLHESQSRLWENLVGRSRPFWEHMYPLAQQAFSEALRDVSLEVFHAAVNRVEPSLIRVEADELTYNLHILARFELEQDLLTGALPVDDAPEAWNARYHTYLGITPETDRDGILQDTHWSQGLIGYFPTYTLGNLYGAQLFAAADRDTGGLDPLIARGDYRPLLEWLREHVHRHGHRYQADQLVEIATGEPVSCQPFVEKLRDKLFPIHNL